MNWRYGGKLLRTHCISPTITGNPSSLANPTDVITSVALDKDWVIVGLLNNNIHVFSSRTGVLARTLVGHDRGVWAVCLVDKGGIWDGPSLSVDDKDNDSDHISHSWRTALGLDLSPDTERRSSPSGPGKRSSPSSVSEGWGQPNALVVSGGIHKVLRVWDLQSGYPIHVLHGHTSTIRCIKVLHNRPIAITGSRDSILRVWDVQKGRPIRTLEGHTGTVRCLDVCGNRVVSGSYDATCRLWDVDTGECIHVMRGHVHQVYSVAFDGDKIASGCLDTNVRVWDAHTGECLALLQGHTALVCHLQLSHSHASNPILATGGSDGRVITFSLSTYVALHQIAAHDLSVTSMQCDERWLVTAGNDGRVRLWEINTGTYVRELTEGGEGVWKVCFGGGNGDQAEGVEGERVSSGGGEVMAIMCRRAGRSVVEIWSMPPEDTMTR